MESNKTMVWAEGQGHLEPIEMAAKKAAIKVWALKASWTLDSDGVLVKQRSLDYALMRLRFGATCLLCEVYAPSSLLAGRPCWQHVWAAQYFEVTYEELAKER